MSSCYSLLLLIYPYTAGHSPRVARISRQQLAVTRDHGINSFFAAMRSTDGELNLQNYYSPAPFNVQKECQCSASSGQTPYLCQCSVASLSVQSSPTSTILRWFYGTSSSLSLSLSLAFCLSLGMGGAMDLQTLKASADLFK